MRVALLSTLEPSVDDAATPRGLLRVGGRSVVHHQMAAALALGCERIVCLAEGLPGELIALQHAAERTGASFQIAADGPAVTRLIKPDDELLVFADGLIAAADAITTLLGGRGGIVVQPVETGIALGFERIDLNHAGGGLIRMPGRLAAGLADLPGDWNPVSALLRIAVQSSLRQVVLPRALPEAGRWTLIRSEVEAHRLEPQWLRQHTAPRQAGGPGRWLAAWLVERLGPTLLHAGTRPVVIATGAAALGLIALGAAWFGSFAPAFAALGLAWLIRRGAAILDRVHGERRGAFPAWLRPQSWFDWLLDGGIGLAIVWRFAAQPGPIAPLTAGFVALVLLGLLRLIPPLFAERRWAAWFEDRLVLGFGLAAASLSEVFALAVMAAALGLLAFALVAAHDRKALDEDAESGGSASAKRLTPP